MLRAIDDSCSALRAVVDLGAHLVGLGRAGLDEHGELDEVAGQAVVAGGGELAGPLRAPCSSPPASVTHSRACSARGAGSRLSGSPSYQPP